MIGALAKSARLARRSATGALPVLAALTAWALTAAIAAQSAPAAPAPPTAHAPAVPSGAKAAPAAQSTVVTEAAQQGVRVERRLHATKGWQPGAPLSLTIEGSAPTGAALQLPTLGATLGAFDVRDEHRSRDAAHGSERLEATLTAWEAGDLHLPAMTASATLADGTRVELALPEATVHIESLLGGDLPLTELASGLRDPVEISTSRWLWWLAASLGAAISCAVAWWLMHRPNEAPAAPALAADQWALREFDRLESDRLPERGEVEGYFVRLSDVVRTYIERRFGIAAPEQTTQEFIRAAGDHPDLSGGHEQTLATFLRTADMVKFAAQRPAGTECGRALDAMRGFVRATAAPEQPPEEAP